jgi:CubicO group peptidase (beta-lactamase class C family)
MSFLLLLSLTLSAWPALAQDEDGEGEGATVNWTEALSLTDELVQAELTSMTRRSLERFNVPGAAVVWIEDGEVVYAEGFGVRAAASDAPVTPETRFLLGSLTSGLTSLFIASLVDHDDLIWDTRAQFVYSSFEVDDLDSSEFMQLYELWSLSSGLPRNDLVWLSPDFGAEQIFEMLLDVEPVARPGETFTGDVMGFAAGVYIGVMAAGGEYGGLYDAYVDLMQTRVFDPLGMETATFSLSDVLVADPNHAAPHTQTIAGELIAAEYPTINGDAPATGAIASALDVAQVLMVLLNDGVLTEEGETREVFSSTSLSHILRPVVDLPSEYELHTLLPGLSDLRRAVGWYTGQFNGTEIIFQPGSVEGFTTLAIMLPELDAGFVILANCDNADLFTFMLFNAVVERITDQRSVSVENFYRIYTARQQESAELTQGARIDVERMASLGGEYTGGWRVELRAGQPAAAEVDEAGEGDEEQPAAPVAGGTMWLQIGNYEWQLIGPVQGDYYIDSGHLKGTVVEFFVGESSAVTLSITTPDGEENWFERTGD